MEIIIYAKYRTYPHGVKSYKRRLKAESIKREKNKYQITFNRVERDRFRDFENKLIIQRNVNNSYTFHIVEEDKWFETKLIEQHDHNSSVFIIEVYKEEPVPNMNCIEV
jgi:hypothetical protein